MASVRIKSLRWFFYSEQLPPEFDGVARLKFSAASQLGDAVYFHVAGLNHNFRFAAAADKAVQLEKLGELDRIRSHGLPGGTLLARDQGARSRIARRTVSISRIFCTDISPTCCDSRVLAIHRICSVMTKLSIVNPPSGR